MSFENKRKYSSTIVYFQSKYEPEIIWEYATHPKYEIEFTKDPCYYCEIPNNFVLNVNQSWTEIHTGEDCEGDIVQTKIIELEPYRNFTTVRYQTGIKNKTRIKLSKNKNGTLISEEQIFKPSLKNISFLSLFSWLMLFTGLLTRFTYKPNDDLYWFKNMENKIKNNN